MECKEVYINWKEDTLHCCNYSFSILKKTKNWKYNVNNRIKSVKYIKTFIKNIEIPKYELPLDFEIIEPIIKIKPIIPINDIILKIDITEEPIIEIIDIIDIPIYELPLDFQIIEPIMILLKMGLKLLKKYDKPIYEVPIIKIEPIIPIIDISLNLKPNN